MQTRVTNGAPRPIFEVIVNFTRPLVALIGPFVVAVVAYAGVANAEDEVADLIIVNAKIISLPPVDHTALAVRGDRILAVGSEATLGKLLGPGTLRIDARGHSVTAGFNDAHVHFLSGSQSLAQVDLTETESIEEIQSRIVEFLRTRPDSACVVGRGWVYGSFPGGLPVKEQLDSVVADRPAIMKCYDGHTVWVNSKALEAAKITRQTPDPEGGIIVRDPVTGEPTGALKESAQRLVDAIIPKPTREEKLSAIRAGIRAAHRFGVTSVQDAGVGVEELELLDALHKQNELPLRMAIALDGRPKMTEADVDQLDQLRRRFDRLNIRAVKLFADGVIEAHTAALLAPYANRPGLGMPETTPEDLDRIVAMLDRRGWQVMIHAIGDAGIRMSLDAFERTAAIRQESTRGESAPSADFVQASDGSRRPPRHRLEHIESISRQDIGRLGPLGVVASMQPYHANPNSNIFQVWAVNLGPERLREPGFGKLFNKPAQHLAFGSDWPVVSIDPRLGMHTAMTRQTIGGEPAGGFLPEQRMGLAEVIDAYTRGSAYAEFAEDEKGSLLTGKLADILIWNQDLQALPADQIIHSRVQYTFFGGKIVFDAGEK